MIALAVHAASHVPHFLIRLSDNRHNCMKWLIKCGVFCFGENIIVFTKTKYTTLIGNISAQPIHELYMHFGHETQTLFDFEAVMHWYLSLYKGLCRNLSKQFSIYSSLMKLQVENFTVILRASLQDPRLDNDPGQFSIKFYVYTSPGWVRVGSIVGDPGQFLFRLVERAGNYWLGWPGSREGLPGKGGWPSLTTVFMKTLINIWLQKGYPPWWFNPG